MRRYILFVLFLCLHWVAWGQTDYEYRYWFDTDEGTQHTGTLAGGANHLDIDITGLDASIHAIHLQVKDSKGEWSVPVTRQFVRLLQTNASDAPMVYWLDGEANRSRLPAQSGHFSLDISALKDGLHTLYLQLASAESPSVVVTRQFIKVPQTEGIDYLTCLCRIDGEPYRNERVSTHGGTVNWNLDVAHLAQGIHNLQLQLVTPSGVATGFSNHFFFRSVLRSEIEDMKLVYSLDGNEFHTMAGDSRNGVFHFDVDVASLEDGLHRLIYHLASGNGTSTRVSTTFFVKTPVGGQGITRYRYWLNDNEAGMRETVLEKRTSPFALVELLPVDEEPIRSTCFHFELTDGRPMMYAKNDFHIAFVDASGRQLQETRQFVDYKISQAVTELTPLESTQTFARPAENEVKWFTFDAEYGDSIALRTDRATSIQVFDATGAEVYSASQDKSVTFGGCHLRTDGRCYVAVHDMTGSGSSITLQTERIDKFAILEYTPTRFAAKGHTLMTFKGNGLEYVTGVELTDGETVLAADTILSTGSDMIVRFSPDEELTASRLYTMNVHFHNAETSDSKTLTLEKAVALEPANEQREVDVKISTEKRVGDPYPIKVTLTNKGNVPLYGIPLNIAFDQPEKLDEFIFMDFDLLLSDSLYNSRDFFTYTDNLVGTGEQGMFLPLFLPYIGANEQLTLTFGIRTKIPHAKFNFYAWAGDPWYGQKRMKARAPSNIQSAYDAIGDVDNLTNFPISPGSATRPYLGAGEAIGGIIQGLTRGREDAVFRTNGMDPSDSDQYRFQYRTPARSPRDIAASSLNIPLPNMGDMAQSNCPNPTSYPVDVYIPGDPNEMTGYEAPSGSRYMPADVATIGYDIEFENDPEIANSAAHRIVIENQLDPTKFDLKTFTPKDITLSGKTVELDGAKSFVKTMDLRPDVNAIAELQCDYSVQTGLIRWTLTSLDPMTMEPTDDIMQGVLPVNHDGTSGIGNVTYTVDLLKAFPDGTEIPNRASIIFDTNDPIETPLWVNTIDAVPPTGMVDEAVLKNDTTATIHCTGSDERSGVWKYEVYTQCGSSDTWEKVGECPADSAYFDFHIEEGMDYGFCALAVDSAGNVEIKEMAREASLATYVPGDANMDGRVDMEDVVTTVNYYLGLTTTIHLRAADVVGDGIIDMEDAVSICNLYLDSTVGPLRTAPRKRMKHKQS